MHTHAHVNTYAVLIWYTSSWHMTKVQKQIFKNQSKLREKNRVS